MYRGYAVIFTTKLFGRLSLKVGKTSSPKFKVCSTGPLPLLLLVDGPWFLCEKRLLEEPAGLMGNGKPETGTAGLRRAS